MVWFGNRAWQAVVILLLTIMISLNLRILLTVNYNEDDMLGMFYSPPLNIASIVPLEGWSESPGSVIFKGIQVFF